MMDCAPILSTMNECYIGDVRDGMRHWIERGVRAQTCVTSPPYWGLRDYGACPCGSGRFDLGQGDATGGNLNYRPAQQFSAACDRCNGTGRIVGTELQIGLEPTFAEYVQTMVEVFRLVRDVLADDGTLWLNLGDSYAQDGGAGWRGKNGQRADRRFTATRDTVAMRDTMRRPPPGLKAKDLCGIPWRVAFALQADGWYLRSDIIWAKPNPMPESVTDRPTKAHEYLFLLAKSERYYYDAAVIAEPGADAYIAATRNRRTVWTIATEPCADAHFATFPTALVEPCIAAGSRVGDVVLDPFMGSGTVAQVAQSLGRRWIGCELNAEYVAMQKRRAAQLGLALI